MSASHILSFKLQMTKPFSYSKILSLYKISENTVFHGPVFSLIRRQSTILFLYDRIQVSGNRILEYFMQCVRKIDDGILQDKWVMQTMKNVNRAFSPESSQTKIASFMDLSRSKQDIIFSWCSTLNSSSLAYTFLSKWWGESCMIIYFTYIIYVPWFL